MWPPVTGPLSWVQVRVAQMAERDSIMQFWCFTCQNDPHKNPKDKFAKTMIGLLVVAAIIAACYWFGVFEMLLPPHIKL